MQPCCLVLYYPWGLTPLGPHTQIIMLSIILHCTFDDEAEQHTLLYVNMSEHIICTYTPLPLCFVFRSVTYMSYSLFRVTTLC